MFVSGNETQAVTKNLKWLRVAAHRHVQNCKYHIRAMSFGQFDLFHILAFDLTSKHNKNIINDVESMIKASMA